MNVDYYTYGGIAHMDFWEEHPVLLACRFCGELFEASMIPQACPHCGRLFEDSVIDMDGGDKHGGGLIFRPATEYESTAFYKLRRQGEKRRIRTDATREPERSENT